MKWSMQWDLSDHNMSLPFDHTCCLYKSELETCQKTVVENYDRSCSFSLLFFQQFNSMLSTNTSTFNTKQHTNSCGQHVLNIFMFLFLSARWILRIHSDSGNFCFQGFLIFFVSLFDICTRFPNWFDVITNGGYNLDSEFSLDLRAHCSGILASRLLTVLRKTMLSIVHSVGFC